MSGGGIQTRVDVEGVPELMNALKDMPLRVAKIGLRKCVNAGGAIVAKEYKASLPKRSGITRKAVRKKVKFYKKSGTYVAIIGAASDVTASPDKPGKYMLTAAAVAGIVERGSKPHAIQPTSGPYKGHTLQHPGAKPQDTLRKVVESTKSRVASAMTAKLAEAVEEAAAKHRK